MRICDEVTKLVRLNIHCGIQSDRESFMSWIVLMN
jgi:hypothetical protein